MGFYFQKEGSTEKPKLVNQSKKWSLMRIISGLQYEGHPKSFRPRHIILWNIIVEYYMYRLYVLYDYMIICIEYV